MEQGAHIRLGESGETLAVRALEREGYAILARGYRTRCGEIDVVALDGSCLVFVEVKTRTTDRYGPPEAAVTRRKRQRIVRMAQDYLARHPRTGATSCRFDVVAVSMAEGGPAVRILKRAFRGDDA